MEIARYERAILVAVIEDLEENLFIRRLPEEIEGKGTAHALSGT